MTISYGGLPESLTASLVYPLTFFMGRACPEKDISFEATIGIFRGVAVSFREFVRCWCHEMMSLAGFQYNQGSLKKTKAGLIVSMGV